MEEKMKAFISMIKKNMATIATTTVLVGVAGVTIYLLRDTLSMIAMIAVLLVVVNLDNIPEYVRQRLVERQREADNITTDQENLLDYVKREVTSVFSSDFGKMLGIYIRSTSLCNPVILTPTGVTVYRFTFYIKNCKNTLDDMAQWVDDQFGLLTLPLGVSAVATGPMADTYTFDIVYVNSKAEQQYIAVARSGRQARLKARSTVVIAPEDEDF